MDTTDSTTPTPRRGRPVTGHAKSAAQRMREYRTRKIVTGYGEKRVEVWLPMAVFFAAHRLAAHRGQTLAQVIADLVTAADETVTRQMGLDSPEWEWYYQAGFEHIKKRNR